MRALTIVDDDDGRFIITVTPADLPTPDMIDLLHRAIAQTVGVELSRLALDHSAAAVDHGAVDGYDAKGIGRKVAAYRREAGLTAEQLAERVGGGITPAAIEELENGYRVEVSTELLVQLARALRVHVALLNPANE